MTRQNTQGAVGHAGLETALNQFDRNWQAGQIPEIEKFLPSAGESASTMAEWIGELAMIDLEYRWRRAGDLHERTTGRADGAEGKPLVRPLVEDYQQRFPQLRDDAIILLLVRQEYRVRHLWGDRPAHGSFQQRFPELGDSLAESLSSLDEELQREHPDPAERSTASRATGRTIGFRDGDEAGPDASQPPLSGRFGRYNIISKLGQGAMGDVYLAYDSKLDRQVALKTPRVDPNSKQELVARFHREAKSAAQLHHANICPVYDVGEIEGRLYLTMGYVEGETLSKHIEADSHLSPTWTAKVIRGIASALAEAHRLGVVHRDLKSGNVMMDHSGQPIVMDFGLATCAVTGAEARLTATNAILGTPAYMSPEQLDKELGEISPATDIYSLGVILFEMLTGQLPFRGSLVSVLRQIPDKQPPRPSELNPEVDPQLESLCLRMMAKAPADRPRSMDEVVATIEQMDFHREPESPPELSLVSQPRYKPARRRRIAVLAVAFLLVGLAAWAATLIFRTSEGTIEIELGEGVDPGIQIEIKTIEGNRVVVVDASNDWQIEATPGNYKVRIRGGDDRLQLSHNRIVVHRGKNEIVRVLLKRASGAGTVEVRLSEEVDRGIQIELQPSGDGSLLVVAAESDWKAAAPPGNYAVLVRGIAERFYESAQRQIVVHEGGHTVIRIGLKAREPLEQWLQGRPQLTVAQDGSAQFTKVQDAIDALQPGQVVNVLDKGPYRETLKIVDPPRDSGLVTSCETVIEPTTWQPILESTENQVAHEIHGGLAFRLAGFLFRGERYEHADLLRCKRSPGLLIERCVFQPIGPHHDAVGPFVRLEFSWGKSAPMVIRECVFGVGLKLRANIESLTYLVERNLFVVERCAALNIDGSPDQVGKHQFLVRHNVIDVRDNNIAIYLRTDWPERTGHVISFVSNSVNAPQSEVFVIGNVLRSGVTFRNNILLTRGVLIRDDNEATLSERVDKWDVSHNAYLRESTDPRALSPSTSGIVEGSRFVNTDMKDSNCFRIASDSPLATGGAGGDLPSYIGALPPGSPADGDWFTALHQRWRNVGNLNTTDSPTVVPRGSMAGEAWKKNGVGMEFCWCPPGKFLMGSADDDPDRGSHEEQIEVTLTQGFWISKFEVTQGQWEKVVGSTIEDQQQGNALYGVGADIPMYFVSHDEVTKFVRLLNEKEREAGRLDESWEYRLPTEAEWEYACRAGTKSVTYLGHRLLRDDEAHFGVKARTGFSTVGKYPPNPWGLHDMLGNVLEWTGDIFQEELPGEIDPAVSPKEDQAGGYFVVRGGGVQWKEELRSAARYQMARDTGNHVIGFRLVLARVKEEVAP